jgi:uncharacterized protein YjbI with pentapeptide repeats
MISTNLSCAEASVWWNEGKMDRIGCVELSGANLSGANLSDADLSGAILTDVEGIPTKKLEAQARDLEGATMPDGQQMPLGLPEKSRSSPSIELEAGEYITDEFQPAFVFEVGRGWVVPSSETPEELPIDGLPGPGAYLNELRFISTKYVFDRSNPSERETVPAPGNADEWASWFRSHPNLESSKPVQVNVGSASGVQIDLTDVTFTSKPGKYPKDCEQPCISLFPSCNFPTCNYGFPYPTPGNEREIVSYADLKGYPKLKDRFVIVDVGGKTVVINIKATAEDSEEFLPKAMKLLDTIEWKGA